MRNSRIDGNEIYIFNWFILHYTLIPYFVFLSKRYIFTRDKDFCPIVMVLRKGIPLTLPYWLPLRTLQWHHAECDGDSNHRRLVCLLSRLFRCRSKKISKLCVTGLSGGNSPLTGEFPTQMPVTRKMFPFDDVIMKMSSGDSGIIDLLPKI